jgi:hypothetical protein
MPRRQVALDERAVQQHFVRLVQDFDGLRNRAVRVEALRDVCEGRVVRGKSDHKAPYELE